MSIFARRKKTIDPEGEGFKNISSGFVGIIKKVFTSKGVLLTLAVVGAAALITWGVVSTVDGSNKQGTINDKNDQITKNEQIIDEQGEKIDGLNDTIVKLEEEVKNKNEVEAQNKELEAKLSARQVKDLVNVVFFEDQTTKNNVDMNTVSFNLRENSDGSTTTILKYAEKNGNKVLYEINAALYRERDLSEKSVVELGTDDYVIMTDAAGFDMTRYESVLGTIQDEAKLEKIKSGLAGEFGIENFNADEAYYRVTRKEGITTITLNYNGEAAVAFTQETRLKPNEIGQYFENKYAPEAEVTMNR